MAVKQNADEDAGSNGKNTAGASGKTTTAKLNNSALPQGLKKLDKVNMDTDANTANIGNGSSNDILCSSTSGININATDENINLINIEPASTSIFAKPNVKVLPQPFQPCIKIQTVLEILDSLPELLAKNHLGDIRDRIVYVLSHVIVPRDSPEAMKEFKEQITKVGNFLAKNTHQEININCLQTVTNIITHLEDNSPRPSPAVAILFELFSQEFILKFVPSMVACTQTDTHRRNCVRLLCDWLVTCNFCSKLNVWIVPFIAHCQNIRSDLCEMFANDNLDILIGALVMPLLRPKVTQVIFFLLSVVNNNPRVFHKIIPRIPKTLRFIHAQARTNNEYTEDTILILQQLRALLSTLMMHYRGYDELYAPVVQALRNSNPSDIQLHSRKENDFSQTSEVDPLRVCPSHNAHAGLVNLGNTCYMNSVLQALVNTKEFSRQILLSNCQSPILIKLQQQIALLLYSIRDELTPTRILNAVRPPGFCCDHQQDSSEFLNHLLEVLHEQEKSFSAKNKHTDPNPVTFRVQTVKTISGASDSTFTDNYDDEDLEENVGLYRRVVQKENTGAAMHDVCDQAYQNINEAGICSSNKLPGNLNQTGCIENSSNLNNSSKCDKININCGDGNAINVSNINLELSTTIEKTFTGKQITTYTCLTCGLKSHVEDVFRDLQLAFPEAENDCMSNYSVQDLLDYYCSTEKLDGDNQYHCDGCKTLRDALRSVRIISAPKYLIITLKHFKYDHTQHTRAKLMHKVYHDEKVTVKVCPKNPVSETIAHYDLYASVVHCGFSMDSGHYYTYAVDAYDKWFKFNDTMVTASEAEELHNLEQPNTPYILFYQMSAVSNEISNDAQQLAASLTSGVQNIKNATDYKCVEFESPVPLTLLELPKCLRDYVELDNMAYLNEMREKRTKIHYSSRNQNHRDWFNDDDDDEGGGGGGGGDGNNLASSATGCGENILSMNSSHFIY